MADGMCSYVVIPDLHPQQITKLVSIHDFLNHNFIWYRQAALQLKNYISLQWPVKILCMGSFSDNSFDLNMYG